jgi:hypothetical protein
MNRVLACALVFSLGVPSMSFAGDGLLDSAARVAQNLARAQAPARQVKPIVPPVLGGDGGQKANFQPAPRGLGTSGLRTRSKILIGLGVAAGFAGLALAIDSRVEDVTPSTKGERTTRPF